MGKRTIRTTTDPSSQLMDYGFTFFEIIISLAILGSAMTILLGLQTSLIDRTISERSQRSSMAIARAILSAVETREETKDPLPPGTYSGDPESVIEQILEGSSKQSTFTKEIEGNSQELTATLDVQLWGIPTINDDAMKRTELKLSWGEARSQTLQFVFFIPADPN